MKNVEVMRTIDFRPHRIEESNLALWWELNEATGDKAFDSSSDFDSSWNPSSIPLILWLDASENSDVETDGNAVTKWKDKSGNLNDLSSPDVNARPNSGSLHNGLNILDFDGNDYLARANSSVDNFDQTWFIVAKLTIEV